MEARLCECGAPARGLVCQRGHRLTEAWSPAARAAALLKRRAKGSLLHPKELKVGTQFDRDGAGGGPYEVLADKGDKWHLKDLDGGHEFHQPKADMPAPYAAKTYKGMRGLHYAGTRGASDDVTKG